MRKVFLFAVVAAMFAACSSKDNLGNTSDSSQQVALSPGEVGFDAYTQRTTTRNGQSGIMDLNALKTSGFGVFGYYTDNNEYEQSRIPDFLYNQKVEWDNTRTYWKYDPIKYWPNEYGNSANSDDNDKISFFAYAPWVEVQPSIGKIVKTNSTDDQWGITALSRNSASGDPLVKYIANFEADKRVDLLWGVCDDTQWPIVQGGTVQNVNDGLKGLPWLNVERPMVAKTQTDLVGNQRMKFTFKHALAQFSVNVDAYVDGLNAANTLDSKTKIYVRQISFTGFAMKGALNLNNVDSDRALWLDYNGSADIESGAAVTIYDGRKDGKEGTAGADASNEKFRGLNPKVISDYNESTGKGNTQEGVTNVTKSLFESTDPVMVIPTGEDMEVEIIYDVETEDDNLSTTLSDGKTPGSSIENRITKTVSFGPDGMQNGKHYTLSLHLGMNSVKFDAAVSEWEEASAKPEADLPLNMPSFVASNSPIEKEVDVTSEAQDYMFAVYGLTPDETVNVTLGGAPVAGSVLNGKTFDVASVGDFTGATANTGTVNASGVAYIRINGGITANNTVKKIARSGYVSVKGASSNKEVKISFAQAAAKLGLGVSSVTTENTLNLTSTASATTWGAEVTSYSVKKNGVTITAGYTWTEATGAGTSIGTYQLPAAVSAGDVYEITVKAGDTPEETFVASIGGIRLQASSGMVTFRENPFTYDALPYNVISNVSQTVTWATTPGTNATVNASTGLISTVLAGNETVTASIAATDDTSKGWYYTNATKTSQNYTLTVSKQKSVLTFDDTTGSVTASAAATTVVTADLGATFMGADDIATVAGTVTYTITKVVKSTDTATDLLTNNYFQISTNALQAGTAGAPATTGTYYVTVSATGTGTANKYEDAAVKTAIVTVTVN